MKKTTKAALLGIAVSLATLAIAPAAGADPTKRDDMYGYEFPNDTLQGESLGANMARVHVIKVGDRELLHRPRLHFIREMLRSVENM